MRLGGGPWKAYRAALKAGGMPALGRLPAYRDSILVAGCQRSGTTALARLLARVEGVKAVRFGHDDELDAAMVLAGMIDHSPDGRYCFQTTYLNEHYNEYLSTNATFRLVWVVRRPDSVVVSMVQNWVRFALNELFLACGLDQCPGAYRSRFDHFGVLGVPPLVRACAAYNGKSLQLRSLAAELPREQLFVLDYDDLVRSPQLVLPRVFCFLGLPYDQDHGSGLHRRSLRRSRRLGGRQRRMVEQHCMPVYQELRRYLSYGEFGTKGDPS